MIRIQLQEGILDMNADETVAVNWTTVRFSTGLRDPFTNDFSIPKTNNNIRLLGTYGLIDSATQMLGTGYAPATMTLDDGQPKSVRIQVVSVTPTEINICCYENVIPAEFLNSNLTDCFEDDSSTIFEWDKRSRTRYTNWFREYRYGMRYNASYAQVHPSKKLIDIFNELNSSTGYHLPVTQNHFPVDYYLIATKKTVCPQNKRQIIEGVYAPQDTDTTDEMRKTLKIIGGQHVTNNMDGYMEESTNTELIYNRHTVVHATMYISWMMHPAYGTYQVQMLRNDTVIQTFYITVPSSKTSGVQQYTFSYTAEQGDAFTFRINGIAFNKLNFLMDCVNTLYTITEEDYGEELVYSANPPRLILYQYYSTDSVHEKPCWADGNTYSFLDEDFSTHTSSISIPYRSLSYFGYWCNVPEFKIKDMVFSICWMGGYKVNIINDKYEYVTASAREKITGSIEQLSPADDHFGKTSTIGYDDDENPWRYSYANEWLANEKALHKSLFGYVTPVKRADNPNAAPIGLIKQYSYSWDEQNSKAEIEFTDIDHPIVMRLVAWSGSTYLAPPRKLSQFSFEHVPCIMKAVINTQHTDLSNTDFVVLDGHEYMVISGETNMKDMVTKITGVLMNYTPQPETRGIQI